jgi:RHS repeat-associated protein
MFTGTADCQVDGGIPGINWTVSFTLTPASTSNNNVDDQCSQSGGSSIGCQDQSLGEDVPIAGTGFYLHYESYRAPGSSGADAVATADAAMIGGWTLNVHHAYDSTNNILFLGSGAQRSAWQLSNSPPTYNGNVLLTSQDGSEVYAFNASGQHLQTLKPLTGALKYQFGYDSAGKLISVTDASGNVTTIARNGSEQATSITSAYSQTSTLNLDSNGFLSEVTDPAGHVNSFVNSSGGLITSRTDPKGNVYNYSYDGQGKLTEDSDPAGGSTSLSNTTSESGFTVDSTTALGRTRKFQVNTGTLGEELTNTWPNGLQPTFSDTPSSKIVQGVIEDQLLQNLTLPDGTSSSTTLIPDPRWGLQTAVPFSRTVTKGTLTMTTSDSRTASLGTIGDPFSLTSQSDTVLLNGLSYSSLYTASNHTYVNTSPMGRTVSETFDSLERIASTQIDGLKAADFAYDSRGRLLTATEGSRETRFSYLPSGFLASVSDPLKLKTAFAYDKDGNLLTTTLPDERDIAYTYDANGNLTSVTPPGKSAHNLAYTSVNLLETYTPPFVTGTGATSYAYDADRDLTTVTRPDGETINYSYDSAGRLISITTPTGTESYSYNSTTGNIVTAAKGKEKISYSYSGPLLAKSNWSGPVAGSVSWVYNDSFLPKSQSLDVSNEVTFKYDNDGLRTGAGPLVIKRNSKNGLIAGTTLGVTTDSRTYDSFGELIDYTASANGAAIYSVEYTRDADGRIAAKTETINGTANTYSYTYDPAGRLTAATENSATDTYTYDTNSNRLSGTTSSGTSGGTFDAQDRMLTYGNDSFTYMSSGELTSETAAGKKTTYEYDVLGNLIAATLPGGSKITYVIDAANRRVGKEVNGVLTTGFLYDGSRVVAQLNGSNAIVSQFIYGTQSAAPDYMVLSGVTYRIFSDSLGSPRLIVNTTTGAVTEQIDYDEFGNVINDTNPGFQPFAFAGGLYDQDTKLVRFGARDYNPAIGRWTAKDRVLFAGGDTNLYEYVFDDPVNKTDPSGEGLGEYIVNLLTSWGIDVGSSAAQGQPPDPTSALDGIPQPDALPGLGPAEQIALNPDNALDICNGIIALVGGGGGVNLQRAVAAANSQ